MTDAAGQEVLGAMLGVAIKIYGCYGVATLRYNVAFDVVHLKGGLPSFPQSLFGEPYLNDVQKCLVILRTYEVRWHLYPAWLTRQIILTL